MSNVHVTTLYVIAWSKAYPVDFYQLHTSLVLHCITKIYRLISRISPYTHTHTRTHARTHAHTHTHTHTHTHNVHRSVFLTNRVSSICCLSNTHFIWLLLFQVWWDSAVFLHSSRAKSFGAVFIFTLVSGSKPGRNCSQPLSKGWYLEDKSRYFTNNAYSVFNNAVTFKCPQIICWFLVLPLIQSVTCNNL